MQVWNKELSLFSKIIWQLQNHPPNTQVTQPHSQSISEPHSHPTQPHSSPTIPLEHYLILRQCNLIPLQCLFILVCLLIPSSTSVTILPPVAVAAIANKDILFTVILCHRRLTIRIRKHSSTNAANSHYVYAPEFQLNPCEYPFTEYTWNKVDNGQGPMWNDRAEVCEVGKNAG